MVRNRKKKGYLTCDIAHLNILQVTFSLDSRFVTAPFKLVKLHCLYAFIACVANEL